MMSPVGGAVGPVLMGYVADNSTMSLSFIIPFVSFCIVLFYSWYADVERTEMNNPDTVVRLYRDCPFLLKFFQLLKNWFG